MADGSRSPGGDADLVGDPPSRLALLIALDAALAIATGARPGPKLLDWIGEWSDTPLRWDDDATPKLFALLERGDVRAWRFLETTGVLERALPELAEAVSRRRADPTLLDPAQVLALHPRRPHQGDRDDDPVAAAEYQKLAHPEWLLLAALILDTAGDDTRLCSSPGVIAQRFDLGAAAEQEIALLVGDSGLYRAAARKLDGLEEERVYPVAAHLEVPERARALYLLTLALGPSLATGARAAR